MRVILTILSLLIVGTSPIFMVGISTTILIIHLAGTAIIAPALGEWVAERNL